MNPTKRHEAGQCLQAQMREKMGEELWQALEREEREMDNQELSKWLAIHVMNWSEDPLSPWGQSSDKAPSYVSEEGGMISQADWNPLSNIKHAVMVMRATKKLWREKND